MRNQQNLPPRHQISKRHQHFNEPIPTHLDRIGKLIVDSAFCVHKELGPGLLEKVYEICFYYELKKRELNYLRQIEIPVHYENMIFDEGLRLDVLVEDSIICELKALENVNPVWEAQILSHLKLTGKRLGYLINFNVPKIKNGIRRYVM